MTFEPFAHEHLGIREAPNLGQRLEHLLEEPVFVALRVEERRILRARQLDLFGALPEKLRSRRGVFVEHLVAPREMAADLRRRGYSGAAFAVGHFHGIARFRVNTVPVRDGPGADAFGSGDFFLELRRVLDVGQRGFRRRRHGRLGRRGRGRLGELGFQLGDAGLAFRHRIGHRFRGHLLGSLGAGRQLVDPLEHLRDGSRIVLGDLVVVLGRRGLLLWLRFG